MSFKILFGTPKHGSMEIHVLYKEQDVSISASYVYPSFYHLLTSLSQVLADTSETSMQWEMEPTQMWFEFLTEDGITTFNIIEYEPSNGKRKLLLSFGINSIELCLIFWRALRKWQTQPEVFLEGWQKPFPDEAMNRFTEKLETARKANKSFRRKNQK